MYVLLRWIEKVQEAIEANKKRGRKTREKIFLLIAESEPDGMTTKELVEATGLKRDRIHTICKEYIDREALKKIPKLRRYHLGPKAIEDSGLTGAFFEQTLIKTGLFSLGKVALTTSSEFCNVEHAVNIFKQKQQQNQKDEQVSKQYDPFDKLYLFEYSLRLGAIISYHLIQSMR